MHPLLTSDDDDEEDLRVLVLSLGSVRLYLEKATNTGGMVCSGWRKIRSMTGRILTRISRHLRTTLARMGVCLFGEERPVNNSNSNSKDSNQNNRKLENASDAAEISLLRDLVKYILHHQFELVLLQELYSEQTFLTLVSIFKEISSSNLTNNSSSSSYYSLGYSHYGELRCQDPVNNKSRSNDVRPSGLAVFSRWPLQSVHLSAFDQSLSRPLLFHCNPFVYISKWFGDSLKSCCCRKMAFKNFENFDPQAQAQMITGALNRANGVQYVQVRIVRNKNLKNPNQNQSTTTTVIHLFNVDLLHRSFIPLSPLKCCSKETTNPERVNQNIEIKTKLDPILEERLLLRLCQAYELAKLVNMVVDAAQIDSSNVNSNLNQNTNNNLILLGGHFGALLGDQFGSIGENQDNIKSKITVQDVLQTFVPGLHNVHQLPEKLFQNCDRNLENPINPLPLPQYRRRLFHSLKSEQVFVKYLSNSRESKNSRLKIEFIHSRLKFGGYLQAVNKGNRYQKLMKPVIETPRAIRFRFVESRKDENIKSVEVANVEDEKTENEIENVNKPKQTNQNKLTEVELHQRWQTSDRRLQVIESFRNQLLNYRRRLRINQAVHSFCLYLALFFPLLASMFTFELPVCIVLTTLVLYGLISAFRLRAPAYQAALQKVDSMVNQLGLEWVKIFMKKNDNENKTNLNSNSNSFDQDLWLRYYREQRNGTAGQVVLSNDDDEQIFVNQNEKNVNNSEVKIKLVESDGEDKDENEIEKMIKDQGTPTTSVEPVTSPTTF